jgi:hypothetical protein
MPNNVGVDEFMKLPVSVEFTPEFKRNVRVLGKDKV